MKLAYLDVKGHYEACGLAIRAIRRGAMVICEPLPEDAYRIYVREDVKHLLGAVCTLADMEVA